MKEWRIELVPHHSHKWFDVFNFEQRHVIPSNAHHGQRWTIYARVGSAINETRAILRDSLLVIHKKGRPRE